MYQALTATTITKKTSIPKQLRSEILPAELHQALQRFRTDCLCNKNKNKQTQTTTSSKKQ